MTSPPLRLAIIGPGRVASQLAADLALVPDVRLVAVAGRRAEPARSFGQAFGCERVVTDAQEVFESPDVDLVYLATPNPTHVDLAVPALAAGKHVLVEKPIAMTADEGEALAAAAHEAGRICMEAMRPLHLPNVKRALHEIAAGRLGALRYVHGTFGLLVPRQDDTRWSAPGGGALADLGVYPVALAQALLGPPVSVAATRIPASGEVDEWTIAELSHSSGAVAHIAVTIDGSLPNELLVAGTLGHAVFWNPIAAPPAVTFRAGQSTGLGAPRHAAGPRASRRNARIAAARVASLLPRRTTWSSARGYGHQYQLLELARSIREGRSAPTVWPLEDSLTMLRTIDRLRAVC